MEEIKCPHCGNIIRKPGFFTIRKCTKCGASFENDKTTGNTTNTAYNNNSYTGSYNSSGQSGYSSTQTAQLTTSKEAQVQSDTNFFSSTIRVNTYMQFQNAVSAGYGKIIVTGEGKDEVLFNYNKMKRNNSASTAAIVIGLFSWPVLAAGVAGKLFVGNIRKYNVVDITAPELVFLHRDRQV